MPRCRGTDDSDDSDDPEESEESEDSENSDDSDLENWHRMWLLVLAAADCRDRMRRSHGSVYFWPRAIGPIHSSRL